MDPRCPGMHLFEVNTQSGITTSEIIVHGDISDEVAIPPPDTKFDKNVDNREVRKKKNVLNLKYLNPNHQQKIIAIFYFSVDGESYISSSKRWI